MTRRIQFIYCFLACLVAFSKFSLRCVEGLASRSLPPQPNPSRRDAVQRMILSGSIFFATTNSPKIASATEQDDDFVSFQVSPFSFEIPKSWKVIVKPNNNKDSNNKKKPKDGKLFSAIDLGTGAVLTVVQEQICSREDYALNERQCDLVMQGEFPPFSSESAFSKDISKLLRRYDDRDNAALQGITILDRVSELSNDQIELNLMATTSIPTGGTYTDRMGLELPYQITRSVQSQVRVIGNDKILSLWLSAPSDEWRKPVSGARLLQVWASVE